MTARVEEICSHLTPCKVFADIGCDHGYLSQYVLEHGLCERAYISDVSAGSLKKAATLLDKYVQAGKCFPVCADGLQGIFEPCDLVLIAGMGGEEIVKILTDSDIPPRFVLQPMKNSEKVRRFLLEHGARLERDYTFAADGKFYDLITGTGTGGDRYTEKELRFGRENLNRPSPAFFGRLEHDKMRLLEALGRPALSSVRREEVEKRLHEIEEIFDELQGTL